MGTGPFSNLPLPFLLRKLQFLWSQFQQNVTAKFENLKIPLNRGRLRPKPTTVYRVWVPRIWVSKLIKAIEKDRE